MLTWLDCVDLFKTCRDPRAGKPLASNARLFRASPADGGEASYVVRLHATDVAEVRPDGSYVIRMGGWNTVTTKRWLRQVAGVAPYSLDGVTVIDVAPPADDPRPPYPSWPYGPGEHEAWRLADRDWRKRNGPIVYEDGCVVRDGYAVVDGRSRRRLQRECAELRAEYRREANRRKREKAREAREVAELATWLADRMVTEDEARAIADDGGICHWQVTSSARDILRLREIVRADELASAGRLGELAALAETRAATAAGQYAASRLDREVGPLLREAEARARELAMARHDVPADVERWAERNRAHLDERTGMLRLVKAVREDGRSAHQLGSARIDHEAYLPGKVVTAPDYEATSVCGAGLHFCATAPEARVYDRQASRFIVCDVPASAVVVIDPSGNKVKAPLAFPVCELAPGEDRAPSFEEVPA